ncbi:hypothetical protein [Flavobacterium sp.]|nr:hypothetical protein [Flavobacterium sp.]
MLIPNRHDETGNYRYGINGKANDDEVKVTGCAIKAPSTWTDLIND